ncbi:MAG: DUF2269 family protein [Aeromicrobium sp.]
MPVGVRKTLLAMHLAVSVGWVGAATAYVALAMAAALSNDVSTVRAAWTAMELVGWTVIVPLAIATLITGVTLALATPWGLFRHYWVLISLGLTIFATTIVVLHMPDVSTRAAQARVADAAQLESQGSDLFHSGIGLVVLLVVLTLNVFKPRGLTRYGSRRKRTAAGRSATPTSSN